LVGRAWAGTAWRTAALAPDAPARERMLHEFIWYLEGGGFDVTRPITSDDVNVFKGVADALDALMERVGDHLGVSAADLSGEDEDSYWYFLEPHVPAVDERAAEECRGRQRRDRSATKALSRAPPVQLCALPKPRAAKGRRLAAAREDVAHADRLPDVPSAAWNVILRSAARRSRELQRTRCPAA
jgi:hypothetical protein